MATQLPHPSPSLTHSLTHSCIQGGDTLLHAACNRGRRDFAELLLANNADPNLQNKVTRGEGWEVVPMV